MNFPTKFPQVCLALSVFISSFIFIAAHAVAQEAPKISACEADIFYSWKKTPPKPVPGQKDAAPPAEAEPAEVFYTRAGEQGAVEEEVKARVEKKLETMKAEALSACREAHEDQARCITTGLKTISKEYNRADYAARGALLKSVTDDCENTNGACVSARTGDVACYLHHPPDEAAAASADAGADDKKKKKK